MTTELNFSSTPSKSKCSCGTAYEVCVVRCRDCSEFQKHKAEAIRKASERVSQIKNLNQPQHI